jgi:hypothetical protein
MNGFGVDPVAIDLRRLVERQVASLYAHLVTRPTGRAVRRAIESQLASAGETALSVIDFSEVHVLDFSCADEVVAKLLLHYQPPEEATRAFFILRGVSDLHLEPIQAVLERRRLAAVAETARGRCRLVGVWSEADARVWRSLEERGALSSGDVPAHLPDEVDRTTLESLVRRGLVFRRSESGDYLALSGLMRSLMG